MIYLFDIDVPRSTFSVRRRYAVDAKTLSTAYKRAMHHTMRQLGHLLENPGMTVNITFVNNYETVS